MDLVYFAHPVTHYGKDIEKECENIIRENLDDIEIFNPNQIWLDRLYKQRKISKYPNPFSIFTEIVGICDIVVGSTFTDGKIGAGVWKELIASYSNYGYPTYAIGNGKFFFDFKPWQLEKLVLTIEETKERIKKEII